MREIRNFVCEGTGEICEDSRCKRSFCILEAEPVELPTRSFGKVVARPANAPRSRLPLEVRLMREKEKIAKEAVWEHEKRKHKRFPSHIRLTHIANLMMSPKVESLAKERLGILRKSKTD